MDVARRLHEHDSRLVAVADGPANEIGMRLAPQSSFHHIFDERKRRGMGGMLKGVEDGGTITVGKVEFARSIGREIMGDYTVDFRSERLDRDCVFG